MKEVSSSLVQFVVTFTIVYCFLIPKTDKILPDFVTNPFGEIKQSFLNLIKPRIERNVIQAPEAFMTTPEIIANRGYPIEVHHVITEDGYILELHRIPYGQRDQPFDFNGTFQRRAVFLQHGMMGTDHFWFTSTTNNSMDPRIAQERTVKLLIVNVKSMYVVTGTDADSNRLMMKGFPTFILADHGYDVWLGNARGNRYSRRHISLNPDEDKEFWKFSWDEMGRYDIPASIDYVLNVTGQEKLAAYFGYSLGCSVFFMGATQHPRLNNQVEIMVGLGPTVSVAHLNNYFRYVAPFVNLYQLYQEWTGIGEVHTNDGFLHTFTRFLCETNQIGAKFGKLWINQIFGNSDVFNEMDFHQMVGHYPAGGSADTMAHLLQNYNSGESFLYFDHGPVENLKRYGTSYPPEYNLTLVTTPVYLVHADSDPFAPPEDVSWLIPRLGNLKGTMRVASPTFTHGDFVWSPRVAELVHLPVLDLLPSPLFFS